MMNTENWYYKKIDEGFYGFNVFSLDEVFDKTEIKGLHTPPNFDESNGVNVWD